MSEGLSIERGDSLRTYLTTWGVREDARWEGDIHSWIRDRALPLKDLIYGIMNERGLSGAMEIRYIFEAQGKDPREAVSNQDYLARRRKLNPYVFEKANWVYLHRFYEGNEAHTWHRYLVLAADGSKFEISNSKENREKYGSAEVGDGRSVARCLHEGLLDVMNGFILHIDIDKVNGREIDSVKRAVEGGRKMIGGREAVILFDRNYVSLGFVQFLVEQGFKFVIRLKSQDYKEERSRMKKKDEDVELIHTNDRLASVRQHDTEAAKKLAKERSTKVRIIKMDFSDGEGALMTNIERPIHGESIRKLYRRRWEIETRYHTLKNKMEGEYTAGRKSLYVEQDFKASMLVHNIIHDMIHQADYRAVRIAKKRGYRYKMHVNENLAIGLFKNQFIRMVMEDDSKSRTRLYDDLREDMQHYLLPYRNLPAKPRKWNRRNKYKCNLKPSY
jgi:hypothetical protein